MSATDLLTLALVVVTAFYAWVTFRILRANEGVVEAMRKQTDAQLRPYVVVAPTVRTGTTLMCLEVQNTGKSPALAGGLLLGVVEAIGMHFTSPSLKSLLSYGIFIAVLLLRPNGLFHRKR